MGVKGLFSVLSEDPRRFGERWTLGAQNGDDGTNVSVPSTIVYIDGPALLHHLLAAYPSLVGSSRGDAVDMSVPPVDDLPPSLFGQVSPEAVCTMAQSFAASLVRAGASEVHLVRDGLASEYKQEAQMGRLADACRRAGLVARQFARRSNDTSTASTIDSKAIGAWDVPHLFAELAMSEAFLDLMTATACDAAGANDSSGPFFVHRAHGEAEGYINYLIECRRIGAENDQLDREEEIVILSSDTDMFVYNMPCFVPLHSLRFEPIVSSARQQNPPFCTISGFKFCRTKFLAAFPNLIPRFARKEEGSFVTMAAVSALAGNDYSLPQRYRSALSAAREEIVRSDIGGLRRRERNAPTAKGTVTAVVRFVGHFVSRDKRLSAAVISTDTSGESNKSSWMWQLASAATSEGRGKGERERNLFDAINLVQKIYVDDATVDEVGFIRRLPQVNNIEIERLVHRSSFFCRVVVETAGDCGRRSYKTKKRRVVNTRRNQKAGKKRRKAAGDEVEEEEEEERSSRSIWRASEFVRVRHSLYDVLAYYLRKFPKNEINHLTLVQEYCRIGSDNFKEVETYIPSPPARIAEGTSKALQGMLEYCFVYDDNMLLEQAQSDDPLVIDLLSRSLEELPMRLWHSFLTAMLLSSKDQVLLFFFMACAPRDFSLSLDGAPQSLEGDIFDVALTLQLAVYHSSLVFDAIPLCFPVDATDVLVEDLVKLEKMRSGTFFRDEFLSTVWQIIVQDGSESEVEKLDTVFGVVERAIGGQVGLDTYRCSVSMLWKHYLLCKQ